MPGSVDRDRSFSVRARDSHHARVVKEASFEAAAVAYVEDFAPAPDHDHGVNVIVRDIDSGHERCFQIDLESGQTAPCG